MTTQEQNGGRNVRTRRNHRRPESQHYLPMPETNEEFRSLPVLLNNPRSQPLRSATTKKTNRKCKHFSLVSICIISHYPFFSNFMECATTIKQLVGAVGFVKSPNSGRHVRKAHLDQSAWDFFIQHPPASDSSNNGNNEASSSNYRGHSKAARMVLHDIQEINQWIERLLIAPVPEEGRSRVEIELFPKHIMSRPPLVFALPDKQRKLWQFTNLIYQF